MRRFVITIIGVLAACGGHKPQPEKRLVVNEAKAEVARPVPQRSHEDCVWIEVFEILDRLYVDPGPAGLTADTQSIVDAIAETIKGNPRIDRLGVVGARAPGEPDALASDRAKTVTDALVARGVPAQKLEAHGYLGALSLETDRKAVWFVMLRVDGDDKRPLSGDARWIPWRLDCDASRKAHRDQGAPLDCDCRK